MYNPKIAIIIPTIHRDDLLLDCIESILEYGDMHLLKIFIIDQNKPETYSERKKIFYNTACATAHLKDDRKIEVIQAPYDSGISYCRNLGVSYANQQNIPYCMITADSIFFTEKMKNIERLLKHLTRYDLIGMNLKDRIGWEGMIKLIPNECFEIDFINTVCKTCSPKKIVIFNCEIVKNFFVAKTEKLVQCQWDNKLKAREHESWFYDAKLQNIKIGYTKFFEGDYNGEKSKKDSSPYSRLREKNMREGLAYLMKKYSIKKWVQYVHLERIKNDKKRN